MRLKGFVKSIFLFILLFILTSCSTFNASLDSLLISPKADKILIGGTWRVENFYYMYKTNSSIGPKIPIESYLFIADNYIRINDSLINYENYKVKTTYLSDYMRIKFKISDFSFLNLKDKEINIFTIEDENKDVYEFLMYDKNTILFYYNDDLMYVYKKTSDSIDKTLEEYVKNNYKNNNLTVQENIVNEGFLISFKSEREILDSSIPKSTYKTVWFFQQEDGEYSYKILNDIIIPKNGDIYSISVKSSEKNNLYEKISIKKFIKETGEFEEITNNTNSNEEFINQFIDITYANENYIGISYDQNTEYLGEIKTNKVGVVSFDEPYIEKRLKFSDIFEDEKEIFYISRKKFLNFLSRENFKNYDNEIREDSFKILRYAGGWFLKGRINPKDGCDIDPIDFDIEVLPNKKLVKNNLSVSLGQIKLKKADVLDVFISPSRDIIVTLTKDNVSVYRIVGNKISNNAIGEFPINPKDITIASEWYEGEEASKINSLIEQIK